VAKVRLLCIITELELGGAQKQLLYTIAHLSENFEIWLVTHDKGILLSDAYEIPGLKLRLIPSLVRPINPLKDLKAFFSLYNFIKKEKFHIVHTHSSKAGILGRWAAKLAGVPVIFHTIHGFAFYEKQNWVVKNLYISLEKLTAKITSRLIAVSQEIIKKGLKAGIGKPLQYQCIYYAIEKDKFFQRKDKSLAVKKLGLKGTIIGTISCLKPQKALQDFIKAAFFVKRKFPEANFLIIGDGYLRSQLERFAIKLKLNGSLLFIGWRKDITELLASMEIFVLSSLWEGMPVSILEAMASGLPVVATAVDGVREIVVDKKTGFLVTPGDYRALAQSITNLIEDKALSREIGKNAQEFISKGLFEPQKMLGALNNLYQKPISSFN